VRAVIGAGAAAAVLAFPPLAAAAPPVLTAVGEQGRHPTATFSAPRADFATIYIATKPDRATDGRFLDENVVDLDILTQSEIQAGRWLYESRLDPGVYHVLLRASPNFEACWITDIGGFDPACADGFSEVRTLAIPRPRVVYRVAVAQDRSSWYLRLNLTLNATPIGRAAIAYRVCWRQATRPVGRLVNRCARSRLPGYGWNLPTSSRVTISALPLQRRTTFSWFVGTRRVGVRTVVLPKD
jgi:hypothetical protein